MLEANQQMVEILIQNLLSNAVQYATKPQLMIRLTAKALYFENEFFTCSP